MWMSISMAIIALAGALGGILNAMASDTGLRQPDLVLESGAHIWRPGFWSNVVFGAAAAFVSWAVYGPLSSADLMTLPQPQLSLASIGGALLVGMSGARWLKSEVDKKMLTLAASKAAAADADPQAAQEMLVVPPADVLKIAAEMAPVPPAR